MARKFNRIQKRSGMYKCTSCGKMTRETGDGESSCELCRKCYNEAGWENSHVDGLHEPGSEPDECPMCRELPKPQSAEIAFLAEHTSDCVVHKDIEARCDCQ